MSRNLLSCFYPKKPRDLTIVAVYTIWDDFLISMHTQVENAGQSEAVIAEEKTATKEQLIALLYTAEAISIQGATDENLRYTLKKFPHIERHFTTKFVLWFPCMKHHSLGELDRHITG